MPSAQTKPDDACRVLCVALLSVLAGRQNPELRMADAAVSFEQDSYEKGLQMIKDGQCVQVGTDALRHHAHASDPAQPEQCC